MKNKTVFIISMLLLLAVSLACNFKFGDTSEDANIEINQKKNSDNKRSEKKIDKENSNNSDSDSPEKIGGYTYQCFDYSLYLIPKNLSADELKKISQKLHDKEPKSFIVLVDDDAKAEQYITHHEQADKGTPEVEFPLEWANRHIVASVIMFLEGEKKWYLTKGYSYEKIAELE